MAETITEYSTKLFIPDLVALFSDGEIYNMSGNIRGFNINTDFNNHVMTYYQFIVDIPPEILTKIHNDKDRMVYSFRLDYRGSDSEDDRLTSNLYEQIILKPLMELNTPIDHYDRYDADSDSADNLDRSYRHEFIAVSEKVLETNKSNVSGILKNVTVDDAVLYLLGKIKGADIYYKPSENKTTYKQMILLPDNVYTNLRYIDDVYGIYKSGLKIYNDVDQLNIIPMEAIDRDSNGHVTVNIRFSDYVPSSNDSSTSIRETISSNGVIVKDINTSIINVSLSDISKVASEIYGSSNIYYGYDNKGTFLRNDFSENIPVDRFGENKKMKVKEDVYNNQYNTYAELNNSKRTVIKLTLNHINLNIKDTFKDFVLKFYNDSYDFHSGSYTVLSMKQLYNTGNLTTYLTLIKNKE